MRRISDTEDPSPPIGGSGHSDSEVLRLEEMTPVFVIPAQAGISWVNIPVILSETKNL